MTKIRDSWETPKDLFDVLNAEFAFDIDVACSPHNSKCGAGITEDMDSLSRNWFRDYSYEWFFDSPTAPTKSAWCNPPYSNPLPWVQKAYEEVNKNAGSVVVMLLNHDASTQWYSSALTYASEIRIMTEKRVQFVPPDGVKASTNSKGQCVIVFRKKQTNAPCHTWHWDWRKAIDGSK